MSSYIRKGVPQRLKPQGKDSTFGTAKAVPLRESRVFQQALAQLQEATFSTAARANS